MTRRIASATRLASAIPIFALALLFTAPAKADAIDGHWCAEDGRHLSIEGPKIVTPGGNSLRGDYNRHFFRYVIPAAEPHAGAQTAMTLVSDDILHLQVQIDAAKMEVWRRCDFTS